MKPPKISTLKGQIQTIWCISSYWFWVGPKHNFDSCFKWKWTWSCFKELSLRSRRLRWGRNRRCVKWFPCFGCKCRLCPSLGNGCRSKLDNQFLFSTSWSSFSNTWSKLCLGRTSWWLCFKNELGNQIRLHAISAITAPLSWCLTSKGDNTWEYTMVKHICWWEYDHWSNSESNDANQGYASHSSTRTQWRYPKFWNIWSSY
jgi:hypothetical protein